MKTDIIYTKDTLFINLSGIMNKKEINNLKKKIYTIVLDYGINNVVIDIRKIITMDKEYFYHFLDEYDSNFNGYLKLKER
jgi:anti-anti-sigma regulatory factor